MSSPSSCLFLERYYGAWCSPSRVRYTAMHRFAPLTAPRRSRTPLFVEEEKAAPKATPAGAEYVTDMAIDPLSGIPEVRPQTCQLDCLWDKRESPRSVSRGARCRRWNKRTPSKAPYPALRMGVIPNGYRPSDRQKAFWAAQAGPNVVCTGTNSAGPEIGADFILKNPTRGLAIRRPLLLFFPKTSFASVLWQARG